MTIQERLIKLNNTFENLHNDFIRLDTEKKTLDSRYQSIIENVKAKYQREKDVLVQQREEILKYYRIAKDNSSKELVHSGVSPMKPDLGRLNTMIEQVNSYNRNDLTAGKIIDLCNAYVAYVEAELNKVSSRENAEIQSMDGNKESDARSLTQKRTRILQDCESYLKGEDVKGLVALFETIHQEYEITPEYFRNWSSNVKHKRMMLVGFSQYRVDVPQKLCSMLKNSLGHHFDENTKMVNCPCGFTTDSHEEIYVEYVNANEQQLKQGIQALILNFLRYFRPTEYKISLFDYIHYNADVLGPMYVFGNMKNGLVEAVPVDEKTLKQSISMLATICRKTESKIGTQTVYEYNRTHKPEERIPYRLLIINCEQEAFRTNDEPEMAYVLNNASKFGITTIRMTKSSDGGSKGKDREKKFLTKSENVIRLISDANGQFYIENDVEWMKFKWIDAPTNIPSDFIQEIETAVKPVEVGTKYFKRYQPTLPSRSIGKRKPVKVPFAINEDDQVIECSFENELFAAYINGAAGSGKSTLLHTIICGLIMNYHPDELELWLLDFKMTELKKYADHQPPHIKYLLLEKSDDLVFDILDRLDEEMADRKFIFSQNGWHKLSDVPPDYYMPVIFVIIDEFAQMSQILKDTKGSGVGSDYAMKLENILREGRAVGFKFIFSSQTYSDGVEGLTESARKQIQQRLAMKNTYQEIKDTLSLSSDAISPAIQNSMNTLPPFESLFKWRTDDGQVRVDHLRNMYTEDGEVDSVADKIASSMTASKDPHGDDTYREKTPILIDGSSPKTFRSQIPYYKHYETNDVLDELDEDDVLIYSGVPCSFNLARPFTLVSGAGENILVVGGDRENELSVILSILNSYSRKRCPIEIWADEKDTIYKRYKTTVLSKYDTITDLEDICNRIFTLKKAVQERKDNNRLIVVLSYEKIINNLETLAEGGEPEEIQEEPQIEAPEDMSQIMEKIKACDDIDEKKRILADYNERVAKYESLRNTVSENKVNVGIYDAREDIEFLIKRLPMQGTHFLFCFGEAKDYLDTKIDVKYFRHKITFALARDDSSEIVGSRKANEIGAGVCLYSNGKDFFTMHPHLYYGVPCNGWQVDDKGNVTQRRS